MATDAFFYLSRLGDPDFSSQQVGSFSIRPFEMRGEVVDAQRCISIDVETRLLLKPYTVKMADVEVDVIFEWVQLNAEFLVVSIPRYPIGRIHISPKGMLPLGSSSNSIATWQWEITPEEVESVERARSNQPNMPITFQVKISGIAKMMNRATRQLLDIVPLQTSYCQHIMELSHWERIIQYMEYKLAPSHIALANAASLQHPSWFEAVGQLERARSHHRAGEDYAALAACLSVLESLVTSPYDAKNWVSRLKSLPEQKIDGLADLFSGLATYCNKVGHHRSRNERDDLGNLIEMPLNHWEADLVVGMTQFVTAYALRLRAAGLLAVD